MTIKLILIRQNHKEFTLKTNNTFLESQEGYVYIKLAENGDYNFAFYPVGENKLSLPFNFNILFTGQTLLSRSKNIIITKLDEQTYLAKIKDKTIEFNNIFNKSIKISDKNAQIDIKNDILCIKCDDKTFSKKINFNFITAEVFDYKDNICVILKNKEQQQAIFHNIKKQNSVKVFNANIIQQENNEITLITSYGDSIGHTKIVKYKLIEDKFQQQINYVSYAFNSPSMPRGTLATAIAFFECIKVGNYSLAKKFTTSSLGKILDAKVMKDYFGDISDIIVASNQTKQLFLLKENSAQKVCVEFEGNFISNINSD